MAAALDSPSVLARAKKLEGKYRWLEALEFYEKYVGAGEQYERSGYALYRAALQATSENEFRRRMYQAVSNYRLARERYNSVDPIATARKSRCNGMISYASFWISREPKVKRGFLEESYGAFKESLVTASLAGLALEYVRAYNQVSMCASALLRFDLDFATRAKIWRETIDFGRKAATFLLTIKDKDELVRAYAGIASFLALAYEFIERDEIEKWRQESLSYWLLATELSEESAMVESLSSFPGGLLYYFFWGPGTNESLRRLTRAMRYCRKTKDNFVIGNALDWIAYHSAWKARLTEDPEEATRSLAKALGCAQDARRRFSLINHVTSRYGVLWAGWPYAEAYWISSEIEANAKKKKQFLERARQAAPELMKRAEESGYPIVIGQAHHNFSKILTSIANLTTEEEKRRLLEEALLHRKESMRVLSTHAPQDRFVQAQEMNYLVGIKSQLASLALGPETKTRLLEEALTEKRSAIGLGAENWLFDREEPSVARFVLLGAWNYECGILLFRLYESTNLLHHLENAIENFERAATWFQKGNLTVRIAECHWRCAWASEILEDHLRAAHSFRLAAKSYRLASRKISQLRSLYNDQESYLQAWSEIAKAKYCHARQEHGLSKKHYEQAALLHQSTKQWSLLAPNYLAWASLEYAEDRSRKEESLTSIRAFQKAASLFLESEKSLKKIGNVEDEEERRMVTALLGAVGLRQEYCKTRILLEEARIHDKKGDHSSSSEKYRRAVGALEHMVQAVQSIEDRKEIQLFLVLAKAWEMMALAEARILPTLYLNASRFFQEAKELSGNENSRLLALGHSYFCKALEAGVRFTNTKDVRQHTALLRDLDRASDCYLKAGFQNFSNYAEANKLLYNAYQYMNRAGKEVDPEKKTKLYTVTEKVLQASAESYRRSGYSGKMKQVLRLLESVKKEKDLALAIMEVFRVPLVVTSTKVFTPVKPTHERAVGIERFERADVQAIINASGKIAKIGEGLDLVLDLVNAGAAPAQLVRVDRLVPEGLQLAGMPESYGIEEGSLNMKGMRLDPLKTERVMLGVKPTAEGLFVLKPRLTYLDENGRSRTHEPEPIHFLVSPIAEFLVKCFVDDYMTKRLAPEYAGWRTLMAIINALGIPKSNVYGDARHGHVFAEPLQRLIQSRLVEYRVFPGERGRGGKITKVRVRYDEQPVKKLVKEMVVQRLET